MEQRLSLITLGVTDLNRSREFYERLGWHRSAANTEGIAFFQAGGIALALYPRLELAKDATIAPEGQGFNGITLAYNTRNRNEVDSVLKEAQAAGATVVKPAQEAF
jgi:catechol 2,3-dioxygenase-like lactoylglutathione lyase family enzyme